MSCAFSRSQTSLFVHGLSLALRWELEATDYLLIWHLPYCCKAVVGENGPLTDIHGISFVISRTKLQITDMKNLNNERKKIHSLCLWWRWSSLGDQSCSKNFKVLSFAVLLLGWWIALLSSHSVSAGGSKRCLLHYMLSSATSVSNRQVYIWLLWNRGSRRRFQLSDRPTHLAYHHSYRLFWLNHWLATHPPDTEQHNVMHFWSPDKFNSSVYSHSSFGLVSTPERLCDSSAATCSSYLNSAALFIQMVIKLMLNQLPPIIENSCLLRL